MDRKHPSIIVITLEIIIFIALAWFLFKIFTW